MRGGLGLGRGRYYDIEQGVPLSQARLLKGMYTVRRVRYDGVNWESHGNGMMGDGDSDAEANGMRMDTEKYAQCVVSWLDECYESKFRCTRHNANGREFTKPQP